MYTDLLNLISNDEYVNTYLLLLLKYKQVHNITFYFNSSFPYEEFYHITTITS